MRWQTHTGHQAFLNRSLYKISKLPLRFALGGIIWCSIDHCDEFNMSDAVVWSWEMKTQKWSYQSRKELILNCLLMKGQHFIYKRGVWKIRARLKRVKMLVWMINHNGSLFWNDLKVRGHKIQKNGSLFQSIIMWKKSKGLNSRLFLPWLKVPRWFLFAIRDWKIAGVAGGVWTFSHIFLVLSQVPWTTQPWQPRNNNSSLPKTYNCQESSFILFQLSQTYFEMDSNFRFKVANVFLLTNRFFTLGWISMKLGAIWKTWRLNLGWGGSPTNLTNQGMSFYWPSSAKS